MKKADILKHCNDGPKWVTLMDGSRIRCIVIGRDYYRQKTHTFIDYKSEPDSYWSLPNRIVTAIEEAED